MHLKNIILLLFLHQLTLGQNLYKWTFNTDGAIHASPCIYGDTLFLGNENGTLFSIDRHKGTKHWSQNFPGGIHATPVVYEDVLLIYTTEGTLYGLNPESGKPKWNFQSAGENQYDLWDYSLSTPKVYEGLVYWGNGSGTMYCIDLKTGKEQWRFQTEGIIRCEPILYNNKVCFGSFDGNLYALDRETGMEMWRFKSVGSTYFPLGELQGFATLDNQTIYFGSRDYNMYAIDANTGRGKWNKKMPSWVIGKPLIHDGVIYFGISDGFMFYALQAENGKEVWRQKLPFRIFAGAIAYKDSILVGNLDGVLYQLSKTNGTILSSYPTHGHLKNKSLVFDAQGGFQKSLLEQFQKDTQLGEAMIYALGSIISSPVCIDTTVYFGSTDGYVYALELE